MKYFYDLHIHSGLSPCADNDMSPVNIVAAASAVGLEIIAVSDHNSIKNVKLTMEIGKLLDIIVVPAIELQTNEDIHFLCLFDTYQNLQKFCDSISFTTLKNKIEVFGNQYIFDEDDNVKEEESLLITSANISESEINKRAYLYGGIAIPAHIDRDSCGILAVLGAVPEGYTTIELSRYAPKEIVNKYTENYHILFNSDAHTLKDIGSVNNTIELPSLEIAGLINFLRSKN